METTTINAELLSKMFLYGAKNLEAKKEWINELNVFPVPDGDTGTNMSLTIMSAAKEVAALESLDMKSLSKAISSGSLRGARGNSGVILSQLFRGFTKVIKEHDEIDVELLAAACDKAVETAYKAVMKPKEGTILTVARGASQKALELSNETTDIVYFTQAVIEEADRVLAKTPDMLPVLKQAGVVDSGGQGLVQVLKGALMALEGKEIDLPLEAESESEKNNEVVKEPEITYGYGVEFVIIPTKPMSDHEAEDLKAFLHSKGDSVSLVADDDMIKVHLHTEEPGQIIIKGQSYGSLTNIKIDNLREEQAERLNKEEAKDEETSEVKEEAPVELKDMGFIAVSIGDGLAEIFKGLGADYLIEGGQTMNPSTEDVLNAIDKVNAKNIFVLPNNKNIILAANQARDLTEDKNIIVIPTKTIPQGITALINFIPEQSVEDNRARMEEEIGLIKTGQVTYAVRDTEIDDKVIHSGDYMGIGDSSILSVNPDREQAIMDMVGQMVDDESAMVSIYYGQEVTEEEANDIAAKLAESYPDLEYEVNFGGQPVYYYIMSVE